MKSFIVLSLFVVMAVCIAVVGSGEGVVAVEGYAHGVALCNGEPGQDEEMVTQEGEYHMWMENGVLYIINYGHLEDKEVDMLKALATSVCAQYHK